MSDDMQQEYRLTKVIGAYVLVAFAILIAGPVTCAINKQNSLREMVRSGADPMIASCAIYAGEYDKVAIQCAALIRKP